MLTAHCHSAPLILTAHRLHSEPFKSLVPLMQDGKGKYAFSTNFQNMSQTAQLLNKLPAL